MMDLMYIYVISIEVDKTTSKPLYLCFACLEFFPKIRNETNLFVCLFLSFFLSFFICFGSTLEKI